MAAAAATNANANANANASPAQTGRAVRDHHHHHHHQQQQQQPRLLSTVSSLCQLLGPPLSIPPQIHRS
eukprot:COSAG05_NODE_468_length_9525_cov_30.402292_7_plen_69_part_00